MTEPVAIDEKYNYIEQQKDIEAIKIIHDSIVSMHQIEWQRTRDIESKATGIVGFVGVIFSLTIASLATLISTADEPVRLKILSDVHLYTYILILGLMVSSIFCGIIALNVKNWRYITADMFIEYCNEEKIKRKDIIIKLIKSNTQTILKNCRLNNQIALWLKWSYYLFMISVIILLHYFIQLLYIFR